MCEDVYSRKIVGYDVYEAESGHYAVGRPLISSGIRTPEIVETDEGAGFVP